MVLKTLAMSTVVTCSFVTSCLGSNLSTESLLTSLKNWASWSL
jgi:hypothetical protein